MNEYQFTGGESTVRHFVRQVKQEWDLLSPPSSIPLEFQAGEFAQFDWGEIIIELNGIEIKCMLFCMRLLYSRKIFVKVFPPQRQEALFQGHLDAFNYFRGVPKTIVYDNMKTAVKKVLEGTKREEQEAFIAFRSAFLFDAQFCAPAKGNEKGQVEKLVQTARAQFLVPVPKVTSFEELNDYLKMCCDRYDLHKVPNLDEFDLRLLQEDFEVAMKRKSMVKLKIWRDKKTYEHVGMLETVDSYSHCAIYSDSTGTKRVPIDEIVSVELLD